jgi:hypothetical protein
VDDQVDRGGHQEWGVVVGGGGEGEGDGDGDGELGCCCRSPSLTHGRVTVGGAAQRRTTTNRRCPGRLSPTSPPTYPLLRCTPPSLSHTRPAVPFLNRVATLTRIQEQTERLVKNRAALLATDGVVQSAHLSAATTLEAMRRLS